MSLVYPFRTGYTHFVQIIRRILCETFSSQYRNWKEATNHWWAQKNWTYRAHSRTIWKFFCSILILVTIYSQNECRKNREMPFESNFKTQSTQGNNVPCLSTVRLRSRHGRENASWKREDRTEEIEATREEERETFLTSIRYVIFYILNRSYVHEEKAEWKTSTDSWLQSHFHWGMFSDVNLIKHLLDTVSQSKCKVEGYGNLLEVFLVGIGFMM